MEQDLEEQKIADFLELKEITGGKTNLNIAGGANEIRIKGGTHHLKISSHIDTLNIFGGFRELNIKSTINNLIIKGGVSKIYVHNFATTQVDNIDIIGGTHEIFIYSFVNKLKIRGGISKVTCNFEHSKINKIETIGGQRDLYLNPNTLNAQILNEGGTFFVHRTEIIPEPSWYQDSISDNEIPVTILNSKSMKEPCVICLNQLKCGEEVYFLPCIHCFHINCLREWVKKSKTCPNCKYELKNKLA